MTPALLPVDEAQSRLLALGAVLPVDHLPLRAAIGRYTAEDISARRTQPAADLSAMDGYAIRFADMPGPWRVIGESGAGHPFDRPVAAGEAARIFTGAAMPAGTDTVLIQEEAGRDGDRLTLTGDGPAHRGRNTRPKGLDFSAGDLLVEAGLRLTPARLAVIATGGVGSVAVRRTVRVAIVSTGDELVEPGGEAAGLALPESNRLMLAAMLASHPVEVIDLGILPDDLDILRDNFASIDADILVTTGGASVGDHDLVRPALEAAGAIIDFWRIALRPGKPMMAGRMRDTIVLGLPGNPVSAFVTATLFLLPLVAHLAGARDPFPRTLTVPLGEDLLANNGRTDYLRGELRDGQAHASTIQDSSMLLTLARSTCLIIRPANAPAAQTGDSAEILMIA